MNDRVNSFPAYAYPQGINQAEREILDHAIAEGLGYTDHMMLLAFARRVLGDVKRKPLMWVMETDSGVVSSTHYMKVADEYAKRPGYTITAIYPRREKQ